MSTPAAITTLLNAQNALNAAKAAMGGAFDQMLSAAADYNNLAGPYNQALADYITAKASAEKALALAKASAGIPFVGDNTQGDFINANFNATIAQNKLKVLQSKIAIASAALENEQLAYNQAVATYLAALITLAAAALAVSNAVNANTFPGTDVTAAQYEEPPLPAVSFDSGGARLGETVPVIDPLQAPSSPGNDTGTNGPGSTGRG